jgi:glycosyltransferase involved in cell wall biosynthesis
MNNISIIISTFGDEHWKSLAERAYKSAKDQTIKTEVIVNHGDSLHESRNAGAENASRDWLIFLDADDELDPEYAENMQRSISELDSNKYLIQPATLGVVDGREDPYPVVIPSKLNILDGNWMVIGTAVNREVFMSVGGFQDFDMYEDWDLWIRCVQHGCIPIIQEKSIYRVNVRNESRNNQNRDKQISVYNKIRNQYLER